MCCKQWHTSVTFPFCKSSVAGTDFCSRNMLHKAATTLRQRIEILKSSFISTVRPTVHTNPFRKRSSNWRNLKTPAFVFVWTENVLKTAFRWRHDNHVISLPEFFSNTNPKSPVIGPFSNSSDVAWTENIRCVFKVNPPFPYSSGVVWSGSKIQPLWIRAL